jgi:hypothetical protein
MNFGLLRRREWHIRPRGPGILPGVPNAMLACWRSATV